MFQPYIASRYGETAADISLAYMENLLDRGCMLMIRAGGEDAGGLLLWTARFGGARTLVSAILPAR